MFHLTTVYFEMFESLKQAEMWAAVQSYGARLMTSLNEIILSKYKDINGSREV